MTNICIIGEAYGEAEEKAKAPFVGASGYELTRMLDDAGIRRSDCYLTNVFNLRPQGNKIESILMGKAEALKGFPALTKGKYVPATLGPELERLGDELVACNPNLIIALGNTPLWALSGRTGVSKLRGTTFISDHTVSGFKCLATYHPAAILRQWELRPVAVLDLAKAERESHYAELRRPKREIWIDPTIEDIEQFYSRHIHGCHRLSVDIETSGNQVTCIGFAPSANLALVVPFVAPKRKGRNYWSTIDLERAAWGIVKRILEDRTIRKTFQNGLYDIAFLWRSMGLRVYGASDDTMLCHHALQPESLKGLGFLGSIYTDEGSWKGMRKTETIKADE